MNNTIKYLYLSILIFAPLALGTTGTGSKLILTFMIFLCATLFFNELKKKKGELKEVPGLLTLLVFGGAIIFQILPLPAFLVKIISPNTHQIYQETAGLLGSVNWIPLTVDLKSTVLQLILYCGFFLFYILTVQLLSDARYLQQVVYLTVGFGGLLALLSLLNHFTALKIFFWLNDSFQGTSFGPYASRNHYAGLMVMLFPVALGMLQYEKLPPSLDASGHLDLKASRYHSVGIFRFLVITLILMGVSLLVSISRGGVVSLSLSLLVVSIFIGINKKKKRSRAITLALLAGVIFISVGWLGWNPVFGRFDKFEAPTEKLSKEEILSIRKNMAGIVKSHPIFGTGAGTFSTIHKTFCKAVSVEPSIAHSHGGYFELMAEQGFMGIACLAAFVILLLNVSLKQFINRHESHAVYLFWGSAAGLGAILIHCVAASQLQVGANVLYFFFLCGLCVAASHTRRRFVSRSSYLKNVQNQRILSVFNVAAPVLLIIGSIAYMGAYAGEIHCENVQNCYAKKKVTDAACKDLPERTLRAAFYDPLESRHLITLTWLDQNVNSAYDSLNRAIRRNPMKAETLQNAAEFFSGRGQLSLAENFYLAALNYEPYTSRIRGEYGFWLIKQGFLEAGSKEMQKAIAMSPGLTRPFVEKMERLHMNQNEITGALPEKVEPFLVIGKHWAEKNNLTRALAAYENAAHNIGNETSIKAEWVQDICRFFIARNMLNEALQAASVGIQYLPNNSNLRYTMGTIYEKMGIRYRAVEEYESAVILDPENNLAQKKVRLIKKVGKK